jgi:hypothetical protein
MVAVPVALMVAGLPLKVAGSRSHPGGCQIRMRPVFSSHGTDAPAPRTVMECGLA